MTNKSESEASVYDPFNPKGVDPIPRHNHQIIGWPGETVLDNIHEETPGDVSFEFVLKKVTAGVDTKIDPKEAHLLEHGKVFYSAVTPYRSCIWHADTPGAAIGSMIRGMAELARSGALDPNKPNRKGSTTIQHVLEILSEKLAWQLEQRHTSLAEVDDTFHDRKTNDAYLNNVARDNEIIAALGTSIAALARVKDL